MFQSYIICQNKTKGKTIMCKLVARYSYIIIDAVLIICKYGDILVYENSSC